MKPSSNAAAVAVPTAEAQPARLDISTRRFSLTADANAYAPTPSQVWDSVRRPAGGSATSSDVINAGAPKHRVAAELEQRLMDVLTRPLSCDESHATGNENREREVRAIFDTLSPIDALLIRRRLDADRADDALVVAFRRLLAERRARLRAYLADPRRALLLR
jgi:hypothetical protein